MSSNSEADNLSDEETLRAYDDLAKTFIGKVESGKARSSQTYSEMKRLLARQKGAHSNGK
jgi:hypothetical protein